MKNLPYLFALLILLGCAPSTKITGSWTSPDKNPEGYRSIFIAAVIDNMQTRQVVENDFKKKLAKLNISSETSSERIKPTFWESKEIDKEAIREIISQNGFDAILTMTLLEKHSEERYIPGTMVYNPMVLGGWGWGRRGTYWGYWVYHYPMMASPGYIVNDNEYIIEINLYDAKTELLIWSAQSKTLNPDSLEKFASDFSTVVLEKMLEEGVLKQYL
ncbi:hypothetical protein [Cecembia calidifontis]|jgi:hypothetical protein|uniref:DUF4136 domain-containing protein n=1 Tax=Cecembia calidifontis TaxID=1187080 RepID=A0A4Q7PD40_9BACT|nr:hypothetical protein [Cecembia calidifontis]RZS97648.1 hypothetical protein BC751_3264 [Cecembia calidifontis]